MLYRVLLIADNTEQTCPYEHEKFVLSNNIMSAYSFAMVEYEPFGDSNKCLNIAYPNTYCHNVLSLMMILMFAF